MTANNAADFFESRSFKTQELMRLPGDVVRKLKVTAAGAVVFGFGNRGFVSNGKRCGFGLEKTGFGGAEFELRAKSLREILLHKIDIPIRGCARVTTCVATLSRCANSRSCDGNFALRVRFDLVQLEFIQLPRCPRLRDPSADLPVIDHPPRVG